MGLKDLFSSSGRSKNRLDRHMRAVVNQYGQSAERYHAMQELLDIGTLPAIVGVMRRFTINSSKSIEDEEEKNWLSKRLSDLDKGLLLSAAREFLPAGTRRTMNSRMQWRDITAYRIADVQHAVERDAARRRTGQIVG